MISPILPVNLSSVSSYNIHAVSFFIGCDPMSSDTGVEFTYTIYNDPLTNLPTLKADFSNYDAISWAESPVQAIGESLRNLVQNKTICQLDKFFIRFYIEPVSSDVTCEYLVRILDGQLGDTPAFEDDISISYFKLCLLNSELALKDSLIKFADSFEVFGETEATFEAVALHLQTTCIVRSAPSEGLVEASEASHWRTIIHGSN